MRINSFDSGSSLASGVMRAAPRGRLLFITVILCLLLFVLVGRLWVLEIVQGERLFTLAENNSIRLIPSPAPRGIIYDRTGKVLVSNRLSFSVTIHPWDLSEEILDETIVHLSSILGLREEQIRQRIEAWPNPFSSVLLKEDIGLKVATVILERRRELAGVDVEILPLRYYPDKERLATVLGYLGEINRQELQDLRNKGYSLGDRMGRDGLEKIYDEYLRGEDGGWQTQISNKGKRIGVLGYREPIPGNDLVLTIDKRLQEIVWESLEGRSGAVIVLNPRTGEILSLVSAPAFDPNLFIPRISKRHWKLLEENHLHPLTNRAIQGQYAPGSIFKIITAAAALEEGLIFEKETFTCNGVFPFKDREFGCWKKEGHGELNLSEAIIHSCDVFFYQLGLRIGVDSLVEFSQKFGLNQPAGIRLLYEKKGLLPTKRWRKNSLDRMWYEGDTVNLSIGQGYLLVTPLQMANLIAAVANGERLYEPQLVKEILSSEGETVWRMKPRVLRTINIKKKTIDFIREALCAVVSDRGTGWRAQVEGFEVAGKTGTAENPLGEDHAWFVGFAPYREPEVALVVLIEHGGKGGEVAAPIAGKIFEAYFQEAATR
jgi:penicillin-binding protein 2